MTDSTLVAAADVKPAARPIEIYRAAKGRELGEAMELAMDPATLRGMTAMVQEGLQDGAFTKVLFSSSVAGMSLTYAWFKKGYPLARHSHSADCLYYVISGGLRYGTELLEAGDGMFVPAGSLYTFATGDEGVEFVEFRTAPSYDMKINQGEKAFERQLEQTKTHAAAWKTAVPPPAARRMMDS